MARASTWVLTITIRGRSSRKLAQLLGQLKNEQSVTTIKNLLKEWGMTSPPALQVARQLNDVLELWARLLVEKVGLVDAT